MKSYFNKEEKYQQRTFSCLNSESYSKGEFIEKIPEYAVYNALLQRYKIDVDKHISELTKILHEKDLTQETFSLLTEEETFGLFDFFQSNHARGGWGYSNSLDTEAWQQKTYQEKQQIFQDLKATNKLMEKLVGLSRNYGSTFYEQKSRYQQALGNFYKDLEFKLTLKLIQGEVLEKEQTKEEQKLTQFLRLMRKIYTRNHYAWHGYPLQEIQKWNPNQKRLEVFAWKPWICEVSERYNRILCTSCLS